MIARLLIVDDEAPARARLSTLLSDVAAECPHEIRASVADAQAALAVLQTEPIDIVLLDVQMPGMSGVELAQTIAAMPAPPALIFITAFDDYAVNAFEVRAVDYLLKPVRAIRLAAALRRVLDARTLVEAAAVMRPAPVDVDNANNANSADNASDPADASAEPGKAVPRTHFSVQERGRLLLVPVEEILYLKAELKYVTLRTLSREYLIEASLLSLEAELEEVFVRVHRNTLVARAAIIGVERAAHSGETGSEGHANEGWQVMLRDLAERLPISRRQWSTIKALVK